MALNAQHIKLAKALPPQLQRFFARYPPAAILPSANLIANTTSSTAAPHEIPAENNVASVDIISTETASSPFRAQKHAVTGRWHDPVYSLRRQADLLKLAREHNVEELMPFSVKSTQEKLRKREQHGLRVQGTGVGMKVKGHEHERTMKSRYVAYQSAMLSSISMALLYKLLTYYIQFGEEKTGYVEHATNDPDLERGTQYIFDLWAGNPLLMNNREVMDVDGRSGQNRCILQCILHCISRRYRDCTTRHREDGVTIFQALCWRTRMTIICIFLYYSLEKNIQKILLDILNDIHMQAKF
jgi:large subunit ribosomal protein L25